MLELLTIVFVAYFAYMIISGIRFRREAKKLEKRLDDLEKRL